MTSDASLVRQTLAGQPEAFGVLVERYSGLAHALILERVRRRDEVEDLVQEAFCAAYTGLGRLRRPARFASWLAGIAAHTALAWVRRESVRAHDEETEAVWTGPTPSLPDEDLERAEEARVLWAALDRLPDELRRLVVLYHCQGCTYRELARFLDTPLATVRWRLRRAEQQLGSAMAEALGKSIRAQEPDHPALRRRILAALPLGLPLATPSQSTLMSWLSGKGGLALLGTWPVGVAMVGVLMGAGVYLWMRPDLHREDDGLPLTEGTAGYPSQPGMRVALAPALARPDSGIWEPPPSPPDAALLRDLVDAEATDLTGSATAAEPENATGRIATTDSGWTKGTSPEPGKPARGYLDDPVAVPGKGRITWEGEYEGTGDLWARPWQQEELSLRLFPKQSFRLSISHEKADTLRVLVQARGRQWGGQCFLATRPRHRTWEGEINTRPDEPKPGFCEYGCKSGGTCRIRYSLTCANDRIDGQVRYLEQMPAKGIDMADAPLVPVQVMIFTVYRTSAP